MKGWVPPCSPTRPAADVFSEFANLAISIRPHACVWLRSRCALRAVLNMAPGRLCDAVPKGGDRVAPIVEIGAVGSPRDINQLAGHYLYLLALGVVIRRRRRVRCGIPKPRRLRDGSSVRSGPTNGSRVGAGSRGTVRAPTASLPGRRPCLRLTSSLIRQRVAAAEHDRTSQVYRYRGGALSNFGVNCL